MLALHFGAGNIGRGFIGSLLYQSGYHTCFVDVNDEIVQLLKEKREYNVVLADQSKEKFLVRNVTGLNSQLEREKVIEAICHAKMITTAVGPTILSIIAELLAEGLLKRSKQTAMPLTIIACENMVGGSKFLEKKIYERIDEKDKTTFKQLYSFPNAAVDRIVPSQVHEDKLQVVVEPFFEWVVEEGVGKLPEIKGIHYVKDLFPYIERKLFTVNTGHAITAYLGYLAGIKQIHEVLAEPKIKGIVENALRETGELLEKKHHFDAEVHKNYRQKIVQRFLNPFIIDEPVRVGRSPLRKLGTDDRLVSPAMQYMELTGKQPLYLAKGIAAALHYDYQGDEEAVALQNTINEEGVAAALEKHSGISETSSLSHLIVDQFHLLKS